MNAAPDSPDDSTEPQKKPFNLNSIPQKYWALMIMAIWGGALLLLGLLRLDTYSMDEGGAMALLLAWSVSEKVIIPVTILGGPDVRALFFWPVSLYWPGSMLAAKIFTLMVMFGGAYALYQWSRKRSDAEVALIATGLLLIAPLSILQVDSIGTAPFLLGTFALALWLDKKYRASPHSISSWYFLQMLLAAGSVTLHPMGLAYPLALAWQWQKNPKNEKQKQQIWLGLGITVVIVLVARLGWIDMQWFNNPLIALHHSILFFDEANLGITSIWGGIVVAAVVIAVLIKDYKSLLEDLMGSMLLIAAVIGLIAADHSWALIILTIVLFRGFPHLIAINENLGKGGFAGKRGFVMVALMLFAVLFMQADKSHARFIKSEVLSPIDELIRTLSKEAQDPDAEFIAASQWPARTMLICRRDVLHLPPAQSNGEELLKKIKGVTHVIFDHRNTNNKPLAQNFAEVAAATQTLAIQQGGVIIKIKPAETNPATHSPGKNEPQTQQ